MEAAITAAKRGHDVWLYERTDTLGGQLLLSSLAPTKKEIDKIRIYLINEVWKTGVEVVLNTELTPSMIREKKPDVLILATGAHPKMPKLPGINGQNVISAYDVLTLRKGVGDKVIVLGGGIRSCETAEFIAEKGKDVSIITIRNRIGYDMGAIAQMVQFRRFKDQNIEMFRNAHCESITMDGLFLFWEGRKQFLPATSIVVVEPFESNRELVDGVSGMIHEFFLIGDCRIPRHLNDAIREGWEAGCKV